MDLKKIWKVISKFDWSTKSIVKAVALLVGAILVFAFVLAALGFAWRMGFGGMERNYTTSSASYGGGYGIGNMVADVDDMVERASSYKMLSSESYAPQAADFAEEAAINFGYDGGADAEEHERVSYDIDYRTHDLANTCNAVEDLKPLDYVIFSNARKNERSCSYTFTVEDTHADDVVSTLKALDPDTWNENTYTLERSYDDTTSEIVILKRKLASLTETLSDAEAAYDTAMSQARGGSDYGAIAQIVNNKVALIERLTQQKLNVQAQIDRYQKNLSRTEEQVEYTHFSVSVQKRLYIDWEHIGNSWWSELDDFIMYMNNTLHHLTFGVLLLLAALVKWAIYGAIILIAGRSAWQAGKRIVTWEPWK